MKKSKGDFLVSVICFTYNHENYIGEAIEGIVNQKTRFSFELIIQDDASSDRTADIIKEYEAKYPKMIRGIFQKTNQYSVLRNRMIYKVLQSAKGKYLAFCEGDDFWTDTLKLQKQFDFMEENQDYGLIHTNYNKFLPKERIN